MGNSEANNLNFRHLHSTSNGPTFLFDDLPCHWQMTRCEKYTFVSLLNAAQPEVALEVGSYQGGSLQQIATHASKVYSLDISSTPRETLSSKFPNVDFVVGDSRIALPRTLEAIAANDEPLGFVFIDGDHTEDGVRSDINAILQYVPKRLLFIVCHDSFNPPCRKGMLTADWTSCEYVHFVEIDFIPGVYHFHAFDTARARSMYGGFAVALMLPEKRSAELAIHQSQKGLFDAVFPKSCHARPGIRDVARFFASRLRKLR